MVKGYKDNYTGSYVSNGNSWSRGRSFNSGSSNNKIPRKRVRLDSSSQNDSKAGGYNRNSPKAKKNWCGN